MINLKGDTWGTFEGTVNTVRGPRLGAVYARKDSVINLGEVRDICFTDPLSCDSGFTISLWLKHRTTYINDATVEQEFLRIGEQDNPEVTFSLFQQEGRTEEHLAIRVSASSRNCLYVFSVPRSLWSHFAFVWKTTHLQIFRNGLMLNEFLNKEGLCAEETQNPVQLPVLTLKGEALYDDLKIWDAMLHPNEIDEMYSCVRGKTTIHIASTVEIMSNNH